MWKGKSELTREKNKAKRSKKAHDKNLCCGLNVFLL